MIGTNSDPDPFKMSWIRNPAENLDPDPLKMSWIRNPAENSDPDPLKMSWIRNPAESSAIMAETDLDRAEHHSQTSRSLSYRYCRAVAQWSGPAGQSS